MRTTLFPRRTALCGAALTLIAGGCATPQTTAAEVERADARPVVVELSDSSIERIADALADRANGMGPRPIAGRAGGVRSPVIVRQPARAAPAVAAPRRSTPVLLPSLNDVASETIKTDAQAAVDRALDWLARHQSEDGAWRADRFVGECGQDVCTGSGKGAYTPGLTGLAVLAFLGNGQTHQGGAHADNVKNGFKYLRQIQDSEGCIGPRTSQHFQYNHALGALALTEGYGLTRSPILREAAQKAVDFVHMSQNPYLGWRYGVRDGDNDTSMTGWAVAVLASARTAGLAVDDTAFSGARSWIDKMTEPEFGRVGYQRRGGLTARTQEAMERFPADLSEAMTASGLLTRLHTGQTPKTSELMQKGIALIAKRPPIWDLEAGTNDFYYWYLGTQVMRRADAVHWDVWSRRLHTALIPHQVQDSDDHAFGSWDPVDAWSADGGRIYATTMNCLSIQALTR